MKDSFKYNVGIGANPIHKFPRKSQHITTRNFMQFNVAQVLEMPKSSAHFKHKTFIRTMPMKRPLMSNINIHKHAYFVPYRVVWPAFIDFREDVPHNHDSGTTIIGMVPYITYEKLCLLFTDSSFSQTTNSTPYDYTTLNPNDTSQTLNYIFKPFGRWAFKLFCSMGLNPPFMNPAKSQSVSALPLLAVAKVYMDYFYPNQYAHYGIYATIDGIFHRQANYELSVVDMKNILQAIYLVSYSSDYFVAAFDKPNMSAMGVQSNDFSISDVSMVDGSSTLAGQSRVVQDSVNGTPFITRGDVSSNSQPPKAITQNIMNQLNALTSYITRHSLSGSLALHRYLADWGVALDADKLQRCYKLGEVDFPLEVGEVLSSADTFNSQTDEGAALGDYGGRAVAFNGDFTFDCDTKEDGLIVIVDTVVPSVSYVQGIMRYWFHKTKLDFLVGDFDGVSIREIKQVELFSGLKRQSSPDAIFGFTQQYSEYKTPEFDFLSGDFKVPTKKVGLQGFETVRLFSDEHLDASFNVVHSFDFCVGNDYDQYNRIFMDDEDDADKFIVVHRLEVEHNMPALPLYDVFPFDDAKKHIKMSIAGSKDN